MEFFIALAAFLASLLTLFSGFGLGTLLTPVFGVFFPLPAAVALTGVVHLLNNFFKLGLLGRRADRGLVLRFGLPSVAGGFLGALALWQLSDAPAIHRWYWGAKTLEITWLKLVIAILMVFFSLMEILPVLKNRTFPPRFLTFGGLLSGFFGGLSGHQGALRSAFLLRCGLDKQAFIATGVVIACLVDLTRLPVYFGRFGQENLWRQWPLLLTAAAAAFAGAYLGARFLQKLTLQSVRTFTTIMILAIAGLLAAGIL